MTTLVRTDPRWAPLLRTMFGHAADEAGNGWNGDTAEEGTMPVDIYEASDEIVVQAAVPGFKRDQLDVQVEKGVLSIKAEARDHGADGGRYYRCELDWSSLSRRIALPGVVDDAKVKADLSDGILTLHIPIAEQAKPRHIEIKTS